MENVAKNSIGTQKKRRFSPLLAILPFFAILLGLALVSFVDSDNAYSATEARSLAQRPVFDLNRPQQIIDGLETYVVDQFPARERIVEAYSRLELMRHKVFSRDVFIESGWIFSRTYRLTDSAMADLVDAAESVAAQGIPTYYGMLPVKNYLVAERPALHVDEFSELNRQQFIDAFAGTDVAVCDIAGEMAEQDAAVRKSQWYATDFHWNGDGAFAASELLLRDMGIDVSLSELLVREEWDAEYRGDLARRFSYLMAEEQKPMVYTPKCASELRYFRSLDDSAEVDRSTVVASGAGQPTVDYSTVYTANSAYYRVENPCAPVDMRVVVFKDSLQDAMTDPLSAVFRELVVVDARYTQEFSPQEIVDGADAVVFLFHQNNAAPDTAKFILGK